MPIPIPEWDVAFGNAIFRSSAIGNNVFKLAPYVGQTAPLVTPINSDGSTTFPAGYTTWGGLGAIGLVAANKTTTGAPADTDFSGATPVVPVPPIGTLVYNTIDSKLFLRAGSASWKGSVAFT